MLNTEGETAGGREFQMWRVRSGVWARQASSERYRQLISWPAGQLLKTIGRKDGGTARGAGVVLEGQSTVCETTGVVLILALGGRLDWLVGST